MTELSVCIVTYQARDLLRECLNSLIAQTKRPCEIIVVDNGSSDGTAAMLSQEFPAVRLVQNQANLGYTRPMNQALRLAAGRYLVQLNPDTILQSSTLDDLADFMDAHPEAGICGPRVTNPDGSLQPQCRRGDARPLAVIAYFLKLDRLFPKNKRLGQYLLTYLDENQTSRVDAVSGSCMLIRREVVDQIGYLDERFFAYQEDSDYCLQARRAGWTVYYVAEAELIHYGGMGGSRVQPYRSIIEWHRSYFRFYRKNLAQDYFFLFNWLYYLLMPLKLAFSLAVNLFRRNKSITGHQPAANSKVEHV
ncbi:MAG: glycosyltransferase family 2 protein [Anaerolineales bacterium]|nr:glycosyltransferase family 2 protein [Anaerolineales bacterium]